MESANQAIIEVIIDLVVLCATWAALIVAETVFPRSRVSWLSRLRAGAYWIVCIATWGIVSVLYGQARQALGIEPLFSTRIAFEAKWLDIIVAVIIGNLIADFFFYWRHRIQHWYFWKYHAVHHSIRELSALNSYHHITEELFRIGLAAVPMALLFNTPYAMIAGLVRSVITLYIHSSSRLNLGPLRWVLIEPAFHRIHHSTDPAHFGRNFGSFTPLWDVLFRTAYFPKKDEWPETGLTDYPEPEGLVDWLNAPWRGRERRVDGAAAEA